MKVNMIKRLLIPVVILFFMNTSATAQTGIIQQLNREQYMAKVKLLDEFFERFNGTETREDVSKEYADRKSGIMLLFDLAKFKSKTDTAFIAAGKFANVVVEENIMLDFADEGWYAKIKCHGKLAGKSISFPMFMKVECRDSTKMYKWVIANVQGDIFLTSRDKAHQELFIMPNDHEQFFGSVRKTTSEAYLFIDDYVRKGYKADALSVFLTLVRSGQLKIEAVSDVEFVFMQVPGYIFTVKHFERESKNAGWLISECYECTENEKKDLIDNICK